MIPQPTPDDADEDMGWNSPALALTFYQTFAMAFTLTFAILFRLFVRVRYRWILERDTIDAEDR